MDLQCPGLRLVSQRFPSILERIDLYNCIHSKVFLYIAKRILTFYKVHECILIYPKALNSMH